MSKLLQVYEHEGVRVEFDARRCIHAGECLRRLPSVFDVASRPWVMPERASADAIIAAVQQCPSGALHVFQNGQPVRLPSTDVSVRVMRNGPLYMRGALHITDSRGDEILNDERAALCRCGQSGRKPFCDGSHRKSGFRDPIDRPD